MAKRIVGILSGKGGVGKTVASINIGIALKNLGEDVIVVDGDVTASSVGLQLGLYDFPVVLQDVIKGKKIEKAIYELSNGLRVMPSSISVKHLNCNSNKLKKIVKKIKANIVILDSPPGLTKDAFTVLDSCTDVIVVTTPDLPSVSNMVKIINIAKKKKKNLIGLILNRSLNDKYELTEEEIKDMSGAKIIATVPENKDVRKSLHIKMPIIEYKPYSRPSISFRKIASIISGKDYKEPKFLFVRNLMSRIR